MKYINGQKWSLSRLFKRLAKDNVGATPTQYGSRNLPATVQSVAFVFTFFIAASGQAQQNPIPSPGFRPEPPSFHVFENARVVVSSELALDHASLALKDGVILGVNLPDEKLTGARKWDMSGKTIYPGWIDLWSSDSSSGGSGGDAFDLEADHDHPWDAELTAGVKYQSLQFYGAPGQETDPGVAGAGYESPMTRSEVRQAEQIRPDNGFFRQRRESGFAALNWVPDQGVFRGTSALVLLSEGDPNQWILKSDTFQTLSFRRTRGSWNRTSFPGSMMGVVALIRQTWVDAQHDLEMWSQYQEDPQLYPRPVFNPSLRALHAAVNRETTLLVEPGNELMTFRASQLAEELGWDWILVSRGQDWRRPDFLKDAGTPVILPVDFPEAPKIKDDAGWDEVSLETLQAWDWAPRNPAMVHEMGIPFAFTMNGVNSAKVFRKNLRLAIENGLPEEEAIRALTETPAKLAGVSSQLGTLERGKIANLVIVHGSTYFQEDNPIHSVWVEGRLFEMDLKGTDKKQSADEDAAGESKDAAVVAENESIEAPDSADADSDQTFYASSPLESRGPVATPKSVLLTNAEIWTSAAAGKLEQASVLVVDGKIAWVGEGHPGEEWTRGIEGLETWDLEGKSLTPGLIDAHSHGMIYGGVNESTLPSSAMVRIADVVNSESRNIELQLAGGLTVANLLHGSANPIGGQSQVIKLKDGADPDELKIESAPDGIKFALGENVKQSNWGDDNTSRFPQTRMGVETFIANRFTAARTYLEQQKQYLAAGKMGVGPRRNLELEAIAEILEGDRWIHCHSYRQDEILMLTRLMDKFGVRIGTFQHVLEGYKVADEIAAHGAGASTFSDWWAYKFEVYDAIAYAGSLMHERGALVSFNSDSSDVARRMNLEAAKAVKYGDTSEVEALKFVTINPAIQLGISDRTGSIEVGKDADFAVWSGNPLDTRSMCLQTWIDGALYFSRESHEKKIQNRIEERLALIQKVKGPEKADANDSGDPSEEGVERFWAIEAESRTTLEYTCREGHQH